MQFKSQRQQSRSLTVNLVPMMDVLMTVLTFFIIISMTLTGQRIAGVSLPQVEEGAQSRDGDEVIENSLIIGVDASGQLILEQAPISQEEALKAAQTYLNENPDGYVVLKADRQLPYKEVVNLLNWLQEVGGAKVLLAVDSPQ
ncbi:MAG: ExbD/TolR family protein [Thainema sp.]